MKRNQEDIQLAQMLKEQSHQAKDNPWFTRRVLNRLPERNHSTRWVWGVVCAIAAVMCVLCWLWMLHDQDFTVLTVRDLTHYAVMIVITLAVMWQGVAAAFQHD